jgi:hypothetical protein
VIKVRASFMVDFHLLTFVVLSRVLHMVSAGSRTCSLSSLGRCNFDAVWKMVRSSAMTGKASREERAGGGEVCGLPALPTVHSR